MSHIEAWNTKRVNKGNLLWKLNLLIFVILRTPIYAFGNGNVEGEYKIANSLSCFISIDISETHAGKKAHGQVDRSSMCCLIQALSIGNYLRRDRFSCLQGLASGSIRNKQLSDLKAQ